MKLVGLMIGASVVSWLGVVRVAGAGADPEALYGMLGPLAVAVVSWTITRRTYLASPERLTGVMVTGLLIKAVFFAVYVVAMIRVMGLRPVPLVASFTSYFIALHVMEALFMRRLFNS